MKTIRWLPLAFLAVATLAGCATDATRPTAEAPKAAPTEPVPLIAREALFGNPTRTSGQISPDGRWLGFIAPRDGVLNVWVAPRDNPADARPVTNDRNRGIRGFSFAYTSNHILYAQDVGGDENFQVFATSLVTGTTRALSPKGARASIAALSRRWPGEVVISHNERDPRFFDLYRVDLRSGESERVFENDRFSSFLVDDNFILRFAGRQTRDGGMEWYQRFGGDWRLWETVGQEDALTTAPAGFTFDGNTLYLLDSRGRNTGALFAIDLRTGERTLLREDSRADVTGTLSHPMTGVVQATSATYLRSNWVALDPEIQPDLDRLRALAGDGEFGVASRTLDDRTWVVAVSRSDAPTTFHLYDRDAGEITFWFNTRPELEGKPLAKMWPVEIPTRDGLVMPSYYTLPTGSDPDGDGRPERPVPMVLLVHGGPWSRDFYGLNPQHQWFANRGYATLAVNFRGSTGFGKTFVNAGDREWGRKMHDDLLDGVAWAVALGIADRARIAIMGASYGGYAALAGVTFTPTEFACGVSIVGPSNLNTLLASIPPYWEPIKRQFATRVGDPETAEGRALLEERSPLNYVDRIQRPLLIGQGANDPRVKQAESDQIVKAMEAKSIPVTYVLFPDEGHGFARPQNRLAFNAVAEAFLGNCLGGRVEPIGDDFAGSSITVPNGAALLEGLPAALAAHQAAIKP
jgi:dipeptidyl aminopeptidase/acylaminoacyl peptidase